MRLLHGLVIIFLAVLWVGCSSTKWVHPYKKEEQFTYDYNKCERYFMNAATTNPSVAMAGGNPMMERQRMNRCLQKEGWRQVEEQ